MSIKLIPVLRPQLPSAERLLPYLHRIDDARIYSNCGPLCAELQDRICAQLELPKSAFVLASSGTAALMSAILAAAGPARRDRPLAIMPAFTFVATAVAAERCGYSPYFQDVEPESWTLDAERLEAQPFVKSAGLIIPVAPFGRPIAQGPWAAFRAKSRIPVVIDGAASFESVARAPAKFIGTIPVALSFHATKSFGMGEGGGVALTNLELARGVSQALDFGFDQGRDSVKAALNGKLSEYHAAVGLAELDGWVAKASSLRNLADRYRKRLGKVGLLDQAVLAPDISSSYALFRCCDVHETEAVQQSLRHAAVEYRMWYGEGVHHHTRYSGCERGPLPITDDLLRCLIGIPVAPDLTDLEVARVTTALAQGVGKC